MGAAPVPSPAVPHSPCGWQAPHVRAPPTSLARDQSRLRPSTWLSDLRVLAGGREAESARGIERAQVRGLLLITFLPRTKCLLFSWLQLPSAVILEPPKIKSATVSIVSTSVCHEVMGPDTWTTALSNSMKLSHATSGHPRQPGHGGEV